LDRRRVLGAALELIEEEGLRALTMRRLGARLGVEGMTVYHYVPSREALLDGIVEMVIDELYGDPEVHMQAPDGWQPYIQRLAHGVLRSLRWMESFLQTLQDCGFNDAAAVAAYRAFSSFLLGHLLLEVSAAGVDIGPVEGEDPGTPQPADLTGYPVLQRLQPELSQDHSAEEFEESLENLMHRMEPPVHRGR